MLALLIFINLRTGSGTHGRATIVFLGDSRPLDVGLTLLRLGVLSFLVRLKNGLQLMGVMISHARCCPL